MRKMLWVLCGLAVAAPAYSAPEAGCMKSREMVLKAASERECPEEEAEAKAMTCEGTAIKDAKRLYVLIKSCHDKPKKGGASASSSAKEAKPAAESKAASGATDIPTAKHVYRAVDADGKVLAMAGSDKSGGTARGDVTDKLRAEQCAGKETITVTYQFYKGDGAWSKGSPEELKCKK